MKTVFPVNLQQSSPLQHYEFFKNSFVHTNPDQCKSSKNILNPQLGKQKVPQNSSHIFYFFSFFLFVLMVLNVTLQRISFMHVLQVQKSKCNIFHIFYILGIKTF